MNINVMTHPLIQHKVARIRSKHTGSKEFRELLEGNHYAHGLRNH